MSLNMQLVALTMENLSKNQFKPYFVATKEEVLPLVKSLVKKGSLVAKGGSLTLEQTGVTSFLKSGEVEYLDVEKPLTPQEKKYLVRKRFFADTFLASANAIIKDGRIYNEDGASTRVSAMIYGPEQVILVVGYNKIVDNLAQAQQKIKQIAPINCKKLGFDTPCVKDGLCHNCNHPQRGCCTTAILNFSREPERIKVIIVGEELGV